MVETTGVGGPVDAAGLGGRDRGYGDKTQDGRTRGHRHLL